MKPIIDFEIFKENIRKAEKSGEIRTSKPISDFDLAVQYAIVKIGDRKGYPLYVTPEEIAAELIKIGFEETMYVNTEEGYGEVDS